MSSNIHPDDPSGVLVGLGADPEWLTDLARHLGTVPAPSAPGRVIRSERGGGDVQLPSGVVRVTTEEPVCTGDWVIIDESTGPPCVAVVLPRRTAVVRRSAIGVAPQVLAANMDEVWVVVPLDRPPVLEGIERTLALAWESDAEPVLIATKRDLVDERAGSAAVAALRAIAPGAAVLSVSNTEGKGLPEIAARLGRGRTAALLGASGAGKSSLLNALAGREAVSVGAVRAFDGKGRHTTTRRELVPAATGGALIDTPGLRGIGMWTDEGGLDAAFADVTDLAPECRFSDCAHDREPGCAVTDAIVSGRLDGRRLESYRKLQLEAAWVSQRRDAQAVTDERRAGTARSKEGWGRSRRW